MKNKGKMAVNIHLYLYFFFQKEVQRKMSHNHVPHCNTVTHADAFKHLLIGC